MKKKRDNKIWKSLKSCFKWLLIIILIFLILSFLDNLNHNFSMMINKINEQGQNINDLHNQISDLKESNNLLANQVQLNNDSIKEVQHKLSIKINNQQVEEIDSTPKELNTNSLIPITIYGIGEVMKSLLNPLRSFSY